jgi:hypothetical protein
MHSLRRGLQSNLLAPALVMALIVLWLLLRGYQGFAGDAQIYAFQALARIHKALSADLYLLNNSQDRFTIFSPFYASLIRWVGLDCAARLLTFFFSTVFFIAAWNLAAAISNRSVAWLAVALLMIASGDYGASGVFRLSEQYLTARLPAEALIIVAFACHVREMRGLGMLVAVAALPVHPLMALPGLLLMVCLSLPVRISVISAVAGVIAALGIASAAGTLPAISHVLVIMDSNWLEVVRERSQFLFPKLWLVHDWGINARPLAYLTFMATAVEDARIRRVCVAGLLVGIAGLAVALIADFVQPLAILVQGQTWRWAWITCFISVLLLPATVSRVWRDEKCGPLCAVLLICGWIVSALGGIACVFLGLTLWLLRAHIRNGAIPYLRWMAIVSGITVVVWADASSWGALTSKLTLGGSQLSAFNRISNTMGVKVSAASLFVLLWWWLRGVRTLWAPISTCVVMFVSSIFIILAPVNQALSVGSQSDIEEFSDWRAAIPETSTVFVAPTRDAGSFVWFTLERPNYLALDQSAGVVFSRQTALEVSRRSEVLLPLTDPTWKILSAIRGASEHTRKAPTRPLTAQSLVQVCGDPQLGFVVSPQSVGFNPMRHDHTDSWKDWYLYDCAVVRLHSDLQGTS